MGGGGGGGVWVHVNGEVKFFENSKKWGVGSVGGVRLRGESG